MRRPIRSDNYLLLRNVELPFEEERNPATGHPVREILEEVIDPFEQYARLGELREGIEYGIFRPSANSITQLYMHREDEWLR
jgi:hypothetical protein